MNFFFGNVSVVLIQFLGVALPLMCLAYRRKTSGPLFAMVLLFVAFCFDNIVLRLPHSFIFSNLHWNWQGKILEFLWPFALVYGLKGLSSKEIGLVQPQKAMIYLYCTILGVLYVLWNFAYSFHVGFPPKGEVNAETILYQTPVMNFL